MFWICVLFQAWAYGMTAFMEESSDQDFESDSDFSSDDLLKSDVKERRGETDFEAGGFEAQKRKKLQ